ncbi:MULTISPECIES: hypothetical protein [unclassified Lentimicrobium]|uniref:hypothetical protein n=1 Tax=unclassified Lentimicrobium TaxID=2677434 RepID=UPI0015540D46|nr:MULTISPECIES: hypothetical protein [unclassified Lentimicrobium]NPD45164.1 hypothetical protein [Lentimicrobium sp. S6]NPD84502.1 hypothetical protein [Lentimicrobium sp. L6]
MKKIILVFIASFMMIGFTQAQKIKIVSGDMGFMKDLAELNVTFEYPEDMKFGKTTQDKYIEKKMADAEEKEEGAGEAWKDSYFADREDHYEPMFMEGMEKYAGDLFVAQDDSDYEYTMIVKTTFTEPGFFMGFQNKKSAIDLEITFVKTDATDEALAVVKITKAPGAAAPDTGLRVGDAYFTAAQQFGKLLKKKYL